MSVRQEITRGIRDSAAIGLGMVPLGMAFGVLVVRTGFSWWWAPVFSVVIYAGSVEFIALAMITGGAGVAVSAATAFMVNFRHLFYGLTFPRENISSPLGRAYSTYALTDESYAIVSALGAKSSPGSLGGARILAIQVTCQVLWVAGGTVGALAGNLLPANLHGTEFALVALFVVLGFESFVGNPDFSLPLAAAGLAVAALIVLPDYMLTVALGGYFALMMARYLHPDLDAALTWKRKGSPCQKP